MHSTPHKVAFTSWNAYVVSPPCARILPSQSYGDVYMDEKRCGQGPLSSLRKTSSIVRNNGVTKNGIAVFDNSRNIKPGVIMSVILVNIHHQVQ